MATRRNPSWFQSASSRRFLFLMFLLTILLTLFFGHILYVGESTRGMFASVSKNETEFQPEQDRLLPLKKMFAEAGEKSKEREKSLSSSSIEVPLADLNGLGNKPQVLLLVMLLTAPARQDRRMAIRETWWIKCIREVLPALFVVVSLSYFSILGRVYSLTCCFADFPQSFPLM